MRRTGKGFTLLEVMIALLILALGLGAISFANSTAMIQVVRITRMTTAAFLVEGVVNDIHAYYVREGFPSNDLEDRRCELPRDFDDTFDCRYDLEGLELEPDMVQSLMEGGVESFLSGGEGAPNPNLPPNSPALKGVPEGVDMSKLAMLAPLLGPDGEELMRLCNINLGGILMGMGALVQYLPMIIEQVSRRTRRLTVRLSWREGPRKNRELEVETYIVSLPEEEVQAMKEAERAREAQEALQDGLVPTTAPSGGPGGAGKSGGDRR